MTVDPANGAECTVEILPDGGRLRPRVRLDIGAVLHPDDLAALLDRYGPDRLLELAATKDAGFTVETFLDALRAIARLGPDDWAEDGIGQYDADRLREVFDTWRAQLTSAG